MKTYCSFVCDALWINIIRYIIMIDITNPLLLNYFI